jgi:hypothetical protein
LKLIQQPFSRLAKFDYVLLEENMVAIVEIRQEAGVFSALWWVAGLTASKRLGVGLQAQFALPVAKPKDADRHVFDAADSLFKLAKNSVDGGGVSPVRLMESLDLPKSSRQHSWGGAFEQEKLFVTQGLELNASTGLQYEFCQLLKVPKPVEFLADHLDVPVTTVRQRIAWARNKGVLEKQRNRAGSPNA